MYRTAHNTVLCLADQRFKMFREVIRAAILMEGAISDLSTLQRYCSRFNPQSYCRELDVDIEKTNTDLILTSWGRTEIRKAAIEAVELWSAPGALGWHVRLRYSDSKRCHPSQVLEAAYQKGIRDGARSV